MKKQVHRDSGTYKDILHLPHYVSNRRPHMPIVDRAAQFSPFAAVVGYDNAVKEAARVTDLKKELDEMEKAVIDDQLREIEARLPESSEVEIVYYKPDEMKAGGRYVSKVGKVKKIDTYEREILMEDGTVVAIEEIYNIDL